MAGLYTDPNREEERKALEEKITRLAEELEPKSEAYLKGALDFVKWTATLTIAAMVWISDTKASIAKPLQIFATAALYLLIASLVFAIFADGRIIIAWGQQWAVTREHKALLDAQKVKEY